jgi:superfamily II DNA or RNA helicase
MPKSTLLVMATGTGKTVVMGETAARWPKGRVMMLAHREELIYQAAQKIGGMCNETCGIEMADLHVSESSTARPRLVMASVQSLNSQRNGKYRFEKFDPLSFGLLMVDEAHHSTATTYRRVIDWFTKTNPALRVLGVTATPDRTDEEALGQVFDSVAFEYGILDAITDGWLVPIEQQFVHVEGLDLSSCKADKRDLKDGDVARVMAQEGLLHRVVDPVIQLAGDSQTLVFAASVEHAHKMAEIFNRHRGGSAFAIDGSTDADIRRERLRAFSRGEFQYLVNMGVFLEGFDEPRIGCVAMARPTKSRALYAQVAGRGTRPLPGVVDGVDAADVRRQLIAGSSKPSMLMLDFVGNSGRHKLVCTADILGGNESDEVVERATANAKRKSARGEKANMREELDQARQELEDELKARHKREQLEAAAAASRRQIVAKAKFTTKAVNPFDIFDVVPKREPGWHKGRRPTEGMKHALKRFKVDEDTIAKLTYCQAGEMISLCKKRAQAGLCTVKQAKILGKHGFSVDVTFNEARRLIDAIAANGWRRPADLVAQVASVQPQEVPF